MNFDDGVMIQCPLVPFGTPVGQAQNLVVRTLQRKGDYDWAHLPRYFPSE